MCAAKTTVSAKTRFGETEIFLPVSTYNDTSLENGHRLCYNTIVLFFSKKGDVLKNFFLLLCFLLISCFVLGGCRLEPDVPASITECTSGTITESDSYPEEPEVPSIDLNAILGKTEYELIITDPRSQTNVITHTQTNLGNLCADAYRGITEADAAIVCASEIDAGIPCGEITVGDVFATLPVECDLITVTATGTEILDCLEAAYQHLPRGSAEYLHVSGITLVLDMNQNPTVETDDAGSFAGISGEHRVTDVRIGDAPLQEETTYTVTFSQSFSYMITSILGDNARAEESNVTNREAFASYISESLSGIVGDAYKNPFGDRRICVIPLGQTEPAAASSSLPQVYLTTEEIITRGEYVSCSITVHDPTGVYSDICDTASTVKIRGNSTSSGEKAPYNIKFSDKTELLGLGKGKKWCLLANLYDKTQLRNTLAYSFAQTAGVNYTSNSCFAEVYLNGEYRGLYQICEPVGVSGTRVDIDTDENEFLLELEPYRGYSNPYCIVTPTINMILGYNEPEKPTDEQRAWLLNFMTDAETALLSGDYDKVKEFIDVESFARCYVVQELFKNIDYILSSTRFYVKDNKLYEGPVWDFDLSSGNCSKSYYPEYNNADTSGLSHEGLHCVSLFNQYLFQYEAFRELVSNLYEELQPVIVNLYRDNELGRNQIDSLVEAYRDSIDRNNALWSTKIRYNLYEHTPVDGTYDGEIAFLKDWLEKRNAWLYDYYCSDIQ